MRQRKCKSCREPFTPELKGASCCSVECALADAKGKREKAVRRQMAQRKRALKSKSDWLKEAQAEFNRFIRLRDADKPCISCGRHHAGQYHAGHYRTTAAQSSLRFNELNCHKQCAPCNNHKSGNITEYRIELTRRIGPKLVEWLEKDHPPCKWSVEEIQAIKKYYRDACKAILADPDQNPVPF